METAVPRAQSSATIGGDPDYAINGPQQPRPLLSETLFQEHSPGFRTFAALPSNVRAIETALLFGSGVHTLAAIVGPSGWGKSHLLDAVCGMIRRENGLVIPVYSALDWTIQPHYSDSSSPVVLDNVQDVLVRPRTRAALRVKLERRARAKKPTMLAFTSTKVTRTIRSILPRSRDWSIALIAEPESGEREIIVRQIATSHAVQLSPIMVRLIARYTVGNGQSLLGVLRRLSLVQQSWTEPADALRGLGVLAPYWSEAGGLDLRDQIYEATSRATAGRSDDCRVPQNEDLSLYVMLHGAGLSEQDVSSYFRLDPGQAYVKAQKVREHLCHHGSLGVVAHITDMLLANYDH